MVVTLIKALGWIAIESCSGSDHSQRQLAKVKRRSRLVRSSGLSITTIAQQVVDVEAFPGYWDDLPRYSSVRVRVISDMNALQAEPRSGRVRHCANAHQFILPTQSNFSSRIQNYRSMPSPVLTYTCLPSILRQLRWIM